MKFLVYHKVQQFQNHLNILIYIKKALKLLDFMLHQNFINLFHQVLFLLCNLLFLLYILIILNSLNVLILYFHQPQTMQANTALLSQKKSSSSSGTSLFTNIYLEEAIYIAVDTVFESYPNIKPFRNEVQKLFKIAKPETHFIFNHKIYDQIDGISWNLLLLLFQLIFSWVAMKSIGQKKLKL